MTHNISHVLDHAAGAVELRREIHTLFDQCHTPVIRIMEVCGTHTMAIARHGIRGLLPSGLELISGPGCPVCVTPPGYIDTALKRVPPVLAVLMHDPDVQLDALLCPSPPPPALPPSCSG